MAGSNTSGSDGPSVPTVNEYPGYFVDSKPPFFKRGWVRVLLAGIVGVVVGALMTGGGASSTPAADRSSGMSQAQVRAKVQSAVSAAVDKAVAAERTRSQQELADANVRLAHLRRAARASQRDAVAAAVSRVRARMQKKLKRAKRQAASATVARSTSSSSTSTSSGSLDPQFSYCYEANAAGYGPYTQGVDPEYYWYEDADNDGVDCEP